MAEDDKLQPDEQAGGETQAESRFDPKVLGFVALALAALVWQLDLLPTGQPSAPSAQPQRASSQTDDSEQDDGETPALDVGAPDEGQALNTIIKDVQKMAQQVQGLQKEIESVKDTNQERARTLRNKLDLKLTELSKQYQRLSKSRVERDYQSSIEDGDAQADDGPSLPDMGASDASGSSGKPPSYAYKPLYGADRRGLQSIADQATGLGSFNPTEGGGGAQSLSSSAGDAAQQGEQPPRRPGPGPAGTERVQDNDRASGRGTGDGGDDGDQPPHDTRSVRVPAGSHIKVTNLHGLDCPVGTTGRGPGEGGGGSVLGPTPVTLVGRGEFRGPNGQSWDLGRVHAIGYCTGLANSQRARIKVQRVSYADGKGYSDGAQIDGYIQDNRDNSQDVAGFYRSTKGRKIAATAVTAGLSKMGQLASQSEFTFAFNDDNNAQSALTGDAFKAGAAQGVGAAFQRVSEIYADQVESSRDRVFVQPNVDMTLHTLRSFEIDVREYNDGV